MRVLVTGAAGLLAAAFVREFGQDHEVHALDRAGLDVTAGARCIQAIADARPNVLINCAACNDVDGAETAPASAISVNAAAVRDLATAARRCDAVFVHFSTDFVFDGETDRPYVESDPPNPRGTYAASKLLGDWFALEYSRAYVLRVESLFGRPGQPRTRLGSLGSIVARIKAGDSVPVFTDRTVSPAYTADIAAAARQLLARQASPGLYHCVNTGAAQWTAIAAEAARLLGLPLTTTPMTLETAGLKAPRPRYSALSNAKLRAAGIAMPPWQDALRRHLQSRD